jgi:hypothetical protein
MSATCSIVSMGSLVTKYHAIGSCPFGQLRSVTATTFIFKLVGDPGAKLLDRTSSTDLADTASVALRVGRAT